MMVLVMVLVCIPIIPFTLVYRHKEGRRGSPDHHQHTTSSPGVSRGVPHGVVTEGSKRGQLAIK